MMHQIPYLFSESLRSLRISFRSSFTSVLIIGVCTTILGLVGISATMAWSVAELEPEKNTLRLFIATSHESADRLEGIRLTLDDLEGIDSILYTSKEQALEEYKEEFGVEMVAELPYNPLPPSYTLYLGNKYTTATASESLRVVLQSVIGVEDVSDVSLYRTWVDKWRGSVLLAVGIVILFITSALFLVISNAVRLNLLSRQLLVENMRYCGASTSFLMTPFVLEGLVLGFLGSLLGLGFIWIVYYLIGQWFPNIDWVAPWAASGGLLFFPAFLGFVASYKTVRQFLHNNDQ
jgi:cell division transport system permease protein